MTSMKYENLNKIKFTETLLAFATSFTTFVMDVDFAAIKCLAQVFG